MPARVELTPSLPGLSPVTGKPMVARFDGGGEWETVPMDAGKDGGYEFTLFAVRDAARYYVTAGRLKSAEHRIEVVDLPTIEKLRLTYDYPGWTGLPKRLEEEGGDIRQEDQDRKEKEDDTIDAVLLPHSEETHIAACFDHRFCPCDVCARAFPRPRSAAGNQVGEA